MLSLEERKAKIVKPEDLDYQIKLATASARRYRTRSKGPTLSLSDKLVFKRLADESNNIALQLKREYFDICDRILAQSQTVNG